MAKVLRAGGEVDSYCTSCKLVLNHRIIAMVGQTPKRVECSTCGSHHNYRAGMPGEKKPAAGASSSSSGPSSTRAPRAATGGRGAAAAATRALQAENERRQTWEKAIAGRAMSDFRVYKITLEFQPGDLVRHSKFGDGVVTNVVDPRKVEVLFQEGSKILAQAVTD